MSEGKRYDGAIIVRDDIMAQITDLNRNFPRVALRARVCMAQSGIRSVKSLHDKLRSAGISVSHQQLSRVIDNKVKHVDVHLMAGLLNVLQCTPAELLTVTAEPVESA